MKPNGISTFRRVFAVVLLTAKQKKKVLHTHDYYEIFLTLTDDISHVVNDKTEILKKGSLVFIRPGDIHLYENNEEPYRFINLAFSEEMANSLFDFVGAELSINKMCTCDYPPTIYLSENECEKAEKLFQAINYVSADKHMEKRLQCKSILIKLFSDYFSRIGAENDINEIPLWLSNAYEQMKSVKYFKQGIPAMVELCDKSYEHISRCLKKYYHITVTEYINSLKLNYAANLLSNTDYSLTDICLECGFNNPTYFSSYFKKVYGETPHEYRKKH